TADMTPTLKAFTDGGGSITANSISFTSNDNDNLTAGTDCSNFAACAEATAGAAAAAASGTLTNPVATDSPQIHTYVSSGPQLTAPGGLSVVTTAQQKAKADGLSVAISGGFAGTIVQAAAIAAGATETYVNGVVKPETGAVEVRSSVDNTVSSHSENVAASL